jgi:CubicO group peptidase (beta-lactamase class C family)
MTDSKFKNVGEVITNLMEKHKVPGAAAGILYDGKVHSAGFGITNIEHPLAVTADTLFQVGSISKTVTATMIMMLVEQEKIDLDATFRSYFPDFKVKDETAAAQATIRHMLTHTSGWAGDVFEDTGQGDDAGARYMALMAEVEQLAPIGTFWSYNNANFYLLGHLIETVTGESYKSAVQKMVFEPLGMKHTYLDPADVITHRFAVGHLIVDDEIKVGRPWAMSRAVYPVGGIVTCLADLLAYAQFHMGDGKTADGKRLLSSESLALMQQPHFEIGGKDQAIGLSWFINDKDGVRLLSHGGGTKGQVSRLVVAPSRNFAFAIFTNGDEGGNITEDATRWVLKEYLGNEITDPKPLETSEDLLIEYSGRYSRPYADVTLTVENGKMIGQVIYKQGFPNRDVPPSPPSPLATFAFYETDMVIAVDDYFDGTRGEFFRHPDDTLGWFRLGGRLYQKMPS